MSEVNLEWTIEVSGHTEAEMRRHAIHRFKQFSGHDIDEDRILLDVRGTEHQDAVWYEGTASTHRVVG